MCKPMLYNALRKLQVNNKAQISPSESDLTLGAIDQVPYSLRGLGAQWTNAHHLAVVSLATIFILNLYVMSLVPSLLWLN